MGGDSVTGLSEAFSSKNVLGTGDNMLTVTSYTLNDGNGGNDYTVTTVDATGTITPAPLTITATSATKVYDGTTSSTATPTFTGLMSVGGDTLTGLSEAFGSKNVLGTGGSTLVVTAYNVNDGDDGQDYDVTTVNATGTLTPAPLTIAATTATKVYDGTSSSSLIPTCAGLFTGAGDTVTGLSQAFTSKNVLGAGASTLTVTGYSVNDGDGGQNYSVTTVNAAGTITPAVLVITATSGTKQYDGTVSSILTPISTGLITVGGDSLTGLTEAFSSKNVLGVDNSTLVVTSYTVNDGDGGRDYTVTVQSVNGTITAAPLIISANDQTMGVGEAVPQLTASYQGLVGGDTSASLTAPVVLVTSATSSSAAGVYPINISGASSPDYAISYHAGTITVSPTTVTLTASENASVYGQSVSFIATVSTVGTPTGTVAFYDGNTLLGTVPVSGSGTAMFTMAAISTGSHAITAIYRGTPEAVGEQSAPVSVTVAQSSSRLVVVQTPVFKKKKLTSLGLTVEIMRSAAGTGVPGGEVTFELMKKSKKKTKPTILGSVVVSGGEATLTLNGQKVKGSAITIIYGGDTNDTASTVTSATIR